MSGATAPGHYWAGPFNDLHRPPPTNFTDRVAKGHDFGYERVGDNHPKSWVNPAYWKYSQADQDFIDAHDQNPGLGSVAGAVGTGFFKFKRAFAPRVGAEPKSGRYRHKWRSGPRAPKNEVMSGVKRHGYAAVPGRGVPHGKRVKVAQLGQGGYATFKKLADDNFFLAKKRKFENYYSGAWINTGRVARPTMPVRIKRKLRGYRAPAVSRGYTQSGTNPGRAQSTVVAGTGGFTGVEKKYVDYNKANATLAADDTITKISPLTILCLNGIVKGSGNSQRIGRKVQLQQLFIQGSVTMAADAAAANKATYVTVWCVLDKQANKLEAPPGNIFKSFTTEKHLAFKNLEYDDRFIIVKKWTFVLQPTYGLVGTSSGHVMRKFSLSKKLRINVEYTDDLGTFASINDNSLQMFAVANSNATDIAIEYTSRLRYIG